MPAARSLRVDRSKTVCNALLALVYFGAADGTVDGLLRAVARSEELLDVAAMTQLRVVELAHRAGLVEPTPETHDRRARVKV